MERDRRAEDENEKQTTEEIKEIIRQQMKSEESIDFQLDLEVRLASHFHGFLMGQ